MTQVEDAIERVVKARGKAQWELESAQHALCGYFAAKGAMMTKEEFEARYAEGSGMTIERLRACEFVACACEQGSCQGWRMKSMAEDSQLAALRSGLKEAT